MKLGKYLDVKSSLLQENALLKLGIVLFAIAALISSITAFRAMKYSRTIVVPSRLASQYSVSENWMSEEGVKAHTREILDLFLNYTPESAKSRFSDLMKMVLLENYPEVHEQLEEELRSIERLKIVSTFLIQNYNIDNDKKEVRVDGLRKKVSHGRPIIDKSETWLVRYEIIESNFKILKVSKYDRSEK
ncbi:MAG: hypothetical protein VR65_04615 [Desulfobulbaceae bacterium BRH_c16a]|nr:MAG: hypothetical protein VR65_04615 [Desulfobulbaceae bacterium BRH_c16a]